MRSETGIVYSGKDLVYGLSMFAVLLLSPATVAADPTKELLARAKVVESKLAVENPTMEESPCADDVVTLLGITSARPGTALARLRVDHQFNKDIKTLNNEFGPQFAEDDRLEKERGRLNSELEQLNKDIARQQQDLAKLETRIETALADYKEAEAAYQAARNKPDPDEASVRYLYSTSQGRLERHNALLEEQKKEAAALNQLNATQHSTIRSTNKVESQLDTLQGQLGTYYRTRKLILKQADDEAKKFNCE